MCHSSINKYCVTSSMDNYIRNRSLVFEGGRGWLGNFPPKNSFVAKTAEKKSCNGSYDPSAVFDFKKIMAQLKGEKKISFPRKLPSPSSQRNNVLCLIWEADHLA